MALCFCSAASALASAFFSEALAVGLRDLAVGLRHGLGFVGLGLGDVLVGLGFGLRDGRRVAAGAVVWAKAAEANSPEISVASNLFMSDSFKVG
jgi:hypothetical protein